MEKIKLNVFQLNELVCGDNKEYAIISREITGTFRHGNENDAIVKRTSDGKFFRVSYRDSVKETCDFEDINHDGEYHEVIPIETVVTIYKPAP